MLVAVAIAVAVVEEGEEGTARGASPTSRLRVRVRRAGGLPIAVSELATQPSALRSAVASGARRGMNCGSEARKGLERGEQQLGKVDLARRASRCQNALAAHERWRRAAVEIEGARKRRSEEAEAPTARAASEARPFLLDGRGIRTACTLLASAAAGRSRYGSPSPSASDQRYLQRKRERESEPGLTRRRRGSEGG